LVRKPEEKRPYERDRDIDGRIILKGIFKKQGVMVWTGCMWLRIGSSSTLSCEHSSPIKGREFLNQLSDHQHLKKYSASCL
jgi:hypothetical protein